MRSPGEMLGKKPRLVAEEPQLCQVINDDFCVKRLRGYQDSHEDIVTAVVTRVKHNGEYWGKPTKFGEAQLLTQKVALRAALLADRLSARRLEIRGNVMSVQRVCLY